MSDSEHEVKIKSTFDDAGFKKLNQEAKKQAQDQKKQVRDATKQQKADDTQRKAGARDRKDTSKEDKRRVADEKRVTEEKKKQTREMREQQRLSRVSNYEFRKAQRTTFRGGFGRAMGFGNPNDPNRPNMRSRLGSATGMAMRAGIGIGGGALAALGMMPIQAISSDYQAYNTYQRQLAGLSGMHQAGRFGMRGMTQEGMMGSLGRMAPLGFEPTEVAANMQSFGRAVGGEGMGAAELGMQASRSTGLDTSTIAAFMAEQRRSQGIFGAGQTREFQRILQAAVEAGMDSSTLPEYMEGIQTMLAGANTRGGVASATPYAQLLSMMGASGVAGLQGSRGAATAQGMENFLTQIGNGGGDDVTRMFGLRAAGYGQDRSMFGAERQLQRGFQGTGGVDRYFNIADMVRSAVQGDNEAYLSEMSHRTGMTQDQIADIDTMRGNGAAEGSIQERLTRATEGELDVLHSINDGMQTFLHSAGLAAGIQLENVRRGQGVADPVEQIQASLREFINDMQPLITTVLPHVADAVSTATEAVSQLIQHLPGGSDANATVDEAFDAIGEDTHQAVRDAGNILRNADGSTNEEIQAVLARLYDLDQQVNTLESDGAVAAQRFVFGQSGVDVAQAAGRARSESRLEALLERNAAALEANTRAHTEGTAAPVVVDTAPLAPMLEGLRTPAAPSMTGGAPQ